MAGTSGGKTALRAFCPAMTSEGDKTWMAATSAAMTSGEDVDGRQQDVDARVKPGHDDLLSP